MLVLIVDMASQPNFSGDFAQNPITLGEIVNSSTEVAFPSLEFNTPPGGLTNTTTGRVVGSSDSTHFINVQAAVVDGHERLWVLDTGRPVANGDNLLASPGGPKLMAFDIGGNAKTPFVTITFPESVLPPNGYLNDIRLDLTPNLTATGKGVAYIADSGMYSYRVLSGTRTADTYSRIVRNYRRRPWYRKVMAPFR